MKQDPKHVPGARHSGRASSSPYPVSRLAPPVSLVDLAADIERGDLLTNTRLSAKLQVIAEQIRSLQAQARSALEEARREQDLNHVECAFRRLPGKTYHLYRRGDGSRYFSMLSPEDWDGVPPHEPMGGYRLERDGAWTPDGTPDALEDDSRELVTRLLGDGRD